MRLIAPLLCLLAATACGQDIDHPAQAAACDPAAMRCSTGQLEGGGSSDGTAGKGGSSGDDQLTTIDGRVIGFADDFFDQGAGFSAQAQVSADGRSGSRVSANYDGTSFELSDVLKTSINWFLTEPAASTGFVPTLMPLDTRSLTADQQVVALVPELSLEAILENLGTLPSTSRAQVVVHVVDGQGRSVTGVLASATAEVVAYRTAGTWLGNDVGTDDSGLLMAGNVSVGSALTRTSVALSGKASARVDVEVLAGATTVVTAVVTPK